MEKRTPVEERVGSSVKWLRKSSLRTHLNAFLKVRKGSNRCLRLECPEEELKGSK